MTMASNCNAGNPNLISCPICNRDFDKDKVEEHVNKCIFLNTKSELPTSKRTASPSHNLSSPQEKRTKFNKVKETSPSSTNIDTTIIKQKDKMSKPTSEFRATPLAERMRPLDVTDLIGQTESFGPGSMLRSLLEQNKIPSMILWGPPGCGKTSLANVVCNICKNQPHLRFVKLSATTSGINDVKEVVKIAKNEAQFKKQTVLFMDEIHRFNKLQQDTFLPHVENGTIILIGATTENPSFSLNNALLSRCRVVIMNKLTVEDILKILERAIYKDNLAQILDSKGNLEKQINRDQPLKFLIERASLQWLAEVSDGDARMALGSLELALSARDPGLDSNGPSFISVDDIKEGIKRSHMVYDKAGEEHYNIISALHKSVRAGDDNAALYWVTRAMHGGEDPRYIARRLLVMSCEDIGLADSSAVVEAVACLQGCQHVGMPDCDVLLAQCAVRLARAAKSREVYDAMRRCQRSLKEHKGPLPSVPLVLRNAPTKLMKQIGYGKGYNMRNMEESGITYMPEGMENVNFFEDD